jgi:hypothetical protein
MSIILVVTSFVGEDTGAVDRTTRVVMAFFFISAAMLGADQNSTIERITARQAADFITEPRDPYERNNRRIINPHRRASGELDWGFIAGTSLSGTKIMPGIACFS